MKTSFAKTAPRLTALVATLALAGCATGSKFSAVETVPDGKALIYVYRMGHIGGIASIHRIYANGEPVAAFANASYYPFIASPGPLAFSSKSRSANAIIDVVNSKDNLLTLDVRRGETYYVEFHIGDTWGPKIFLVDAQTGSKKILQCRLAETFAKKD